MEGAAEPAGVGMADMVKACFVNTDMLVVYAVCGVRYELWKIELMSQSDWCLLRKM